MALPLLVQTDLSFVFHLRQTFFTGWTFHMHKTKTRRKTSKKKTNNKWKSVQWIYGELRFLSLLQAIFVGWFERCEWCARGHFNSNRNSLHINGLLFILSAFHSIPFHSIPHTHSNNFFRLLLLLLCSLHLHKWCLWPFFIHIISNLKMFS